MRAAGSSPVERQVRVSERRILHARRRKISRAFLVLLLLLGFPPATEPEAEREQVVMRSAAGPSLSRVVFFHGQMVRGGTADWSVTRDSCGRAHVRCVSLVRVFAAYSWPRT